MFSLQLASLGTVLGRRNPSKVSTEKTLLADSTRHITKMSLRTACMFVFAFQKIVCDVCRAQRSAAGNCPSPAVPRCMLPACETANFLRFRLHKYCPTAYPLALVPGWEDMKHMSHGLQFCHHPAPSFLTPQQVKNEDETKKVSPPPYRSLLLLLLVSLVTDQAGRIAVSGRLGRLQSLHPRRPDPVVGLQASHLTVAIWPEAPFQNVRLAI